MAIKPILTSGILLAALIALAGCIEDDGGCAEPTPEQLVVGVTSPGIGSERVTFAFQCETVDAAYTIDRYDFRLVLGRAGTVSIAPEPAALAAEAEGSVTYFVPIQDGPAKVLTTAPDEGPPAYEVQFTRWDPEHNENREPRIHITWDQDRDDEPDILPGGLYGVQLSLRSGDDHRNWFVTSIDH